MAPNWVYQPVVYGYPQSNSLNFTPMITCRFLSFIVCSYLLINVNLYHKKTLMLQKLQIFSTQLDGIKFTTVSHFSILGFTYKYTDK